MRSKKAILNIITSLLLQVVVLICGFIVPKLIITKFGSNVNGLISSITQFLAYITLLEAGFGPVVKAALYKPIASKNKKQIENILKASEKFFRVIALIFIAYLIVLSITYPAIVSSQFAYMYTLSLVLIISISTLAEYYFGMTYKLYLQAEQKTYITSIIQMVGYILNTLAIIVLVKCNASIQVVKLVSSIIFVLRPIVQNIYVRKKYNINLKDADKDYQLKQKWDGLAQHIAAVIHNNTDITILTFFTQITEVSVYSVYYLVVKGIKSIIQAFTGGIDASFGDMIAKGEKEQLNKSFKTYELFYYTITTIAYTCTILLIVPFITVYTLGITDANYIRPVFATLLVLGEFVWAIRLPYSSITLAAGHFKQTQKGAWVEAFSNIIISVILVWKFGIVGVAIGTLVAMLIRTIEFVYHTNKYILERKQSKSLIRFGIIALQLIAVALLSKLLPTYEFTNYFIWIKYACMVLVLTIIIVLPVNLIVYRNDAKDLLGIVKRNILRKKETN
ncbi:MAG: polysaccharide biosynthesis C-terminal domain-containing protein [Clostridia bacterium]